MLRLLKNLSIDQCVVWARENVAKKKKIWKGDFHFHIGGNIDFDLISQVTMTYPVEFKLINFIIIDILIFLVME